MRFVENGQALVAKGGNETLEVRAWGRNGLRVRSTRYPEFTGKNVALDYVKPQDGEVEIRIEEDFSEIRNGMLRCVIKKRGWMEFYKGDKLILKEYYRSFVIANEHSPSMKVDARFHCFGCGADGDVIDFTARLHGLDVKAAAEKLGLNSNH